MNRSIVASLALLGLSAVGIGAVNAVVVAGGRAELRNREHDASIARWTTTSGERSTRERSERGARAPAPADFVVVPAARVYPGGRPCIALRDRLDRAFEIYRAGKARRILVSGNDAPSANREPTVMRAYLEARGVPAADVVLDASGFDTYSAMWRARHAFGAESVIVVTQSFHLGRAVFLARAVGLDAEGSRSDQHAYRGLAKDHVREVAARVKAALDVAVGRRPLDGARREEV